MLLLARGLREIYVTVQFTHFLEEIMHRYLAVLALYNNGFPMWSYTWVFDSNVPSSCPTVRDIGFTPLIFG